MPRNLSINRNAREIIKKLKTHGYQAYLVGGSVRDLMLGIKPEEWDITTDARPEEVGELFNKVVPTGIEFGTVTVLLNDQTFEVTTFRRDEKYLDGRHPQSVTFSKDLKEDLSRRDFTINALAFDPDGAKFIDHFNGIKDLHGKLIRAVGDPLKRFKEDGLRPLRACRFAAKLNFKIEPLTLKAISATLDVAERVSPERVHDELVKMLKAKKPSIGLEYMRQSGLLKLYLPELLKCYKVEQPPEYHKFDVYWHSLFSSDAAPAGNYVVRLAALLHDIGKPPAKVDLTFYNHDKLGKEMAVKLLKRLRFSNSDIEAVANLIDNHMFDYHSDWSDAAVRRFIRRVGEGNLDDLFALRLADAKAMHQVDNSYLKELKARIARIIKEEQALHVKDLKIKGEDVMRELNILPGPRVGKVLDELLEKVLEDPSLNTKEKLLKLIK